MRQQVVFINGGVPKENYSSYYEYLESVEYNPQKEKFLNWNKTLGETLGDDFIFLKAPLLSNDFADYQAWKIMFEKMFPYLQNNIILVTTSLGSSFILKYLSESDFPVNIKKLFFIAPAVRDTPEEKLGSFAARLEYATRLRRFVDDIYIYHSRDDDCVPFEQGLELHSYFPDSIFREFDSRGHFYLEERIKELEEDIKA